MNRNLPSSGAGPKSSPPSCSTSQGSAAGASRSSNRVPARRNGQVPESPNSLSSNTAFAASTFKFGAGVNHDKMGSQRENSNQVQYRNPMDVSPDNEAASAVHTQGPPASSATFTGSVFRPVASVPNRNASSQSALYSFGPIPAQIQRVIEMPQSASPSTSQGSVQHVWQELRDAQQALMFPLQGTLQDFLQLLHDAPQILNFRPQGSVPELQQRLQMAQQVLNSLPQGSVPQFTQQLHQVQQALCFDLQGTMKQFVQRLLQVLQVLNTFPEDFQQFKRHLELHLQQDPMRDFLLQVQQALNCFQQDPVQLSLLHAQLHQLQRVLDFPSSGTLKEFLERLQSLQQVLRCLQQASLAQSDTSQKSGVKRKRKPDISEGFPLKIEDKVGLLQTVFQAEEYVHKQDGTLRKDVKVTLQVWEENPALVVTWVRPSSQMNQEYPYQIQTFKSNEAFPKIRITGSSLTFLYVVGVEEQAENEKMEYVLGETSIVVVLEKNKKGQWFFDLEKNGRCASIKNFMTFLFITEVNNTTFAAVWLKSHSGRGSKSNSVKFLQLKFKNPDTGSDPESAMSISTSWSEPAVQPNSIPASSSEPAVQANPSSASSNPAVPSKPSRLFVKLEDEVTEKGWQSRKAQMMGATLIRGWGRGCLIILVEFPSLEARDRVLDQINNGSFRLDGSPARLATEAEASIFGQQDQESSATSSDSELAETDAEDDNLQQSTSSPSVFQEEKCLLCHDAVSDAEARVSGQQDEDAGATSSGSKLAEMDTEGDDFQESTATESVLRAEKFLLCHEAILDGHAEQHGDPKPVALPLIVSTRLVGNDSSRIAFGSSDATCTRILKALDGCWRSPNDLSRKIVASCCNDSSFVQSLKLVSSPSEMQLLESITIKHQSMSMTPASFDPTMFPSNPTTPKTGQEVLQRAELAWETIVVVSLGDRPTRSLGAFYVVPTAVETSDRCQVMLQVEVEVNTAGRHFVLDSSVDRILHGLNSPDSWNRLILTAALTTLSAQGMLEQQASRPGFYEPLLKLLDDVDELIVLSALTVICNVISTDQNAEIFSKCLQPRLLALLLHSNPEIAGRADAVIHNLLCFLDLTKFITKAIETVNEDEDLEQNLRQSLVKRISALEAEEAFALPGKGLDQPSRLSLVEEVSAIGVEGKASLPKQPDMMYEDTGLEPLPKQPDTMNEDKEPALPTIEQIVEYICTIYPKESRGSVSKLDEFSASNASPQLLPEGQSENRSEVLGSPMVDNSLFIPVLPSNPKDYEVFVKRELESSTEKIRHSFRRWELLKKKSERSHDRADHMEDIIYGGVRQVDKFLAFVLSPVLSPGPADQSIPLSGSLRQIICDFLVNVWHDLRPAGSSAVPWIIRFLELAPDMGDALFIAAAERRSSARLFLDVISKGEEKLILLPKQRLLSFFVDHAFNSGLSQIEATAMVKLIHMGAVDPHSAAQTFETLHKDSPAVADWSMPLLSAFSVLLCDPAHIRQVHPVLQSLILRPDEMFLSYVTKMVKALDPFIQSGSDYEADLLLSLAPLLVPKNEFHLVFPLAENFTKYCKTTQLLIREQGFPYFVEHAFNSTSSDTYDTKAVVTLSRHIAALDSNFAARTFEMLYKHAPPVANWSLPVLAAFSVLLCDPAHICEIHPVLNSLNSHPDEKFVSYVTRIVKALSPFIESGSNYEADVLLPLAPLLVSEKEKFQLVLPLAENFSKFSKETKLLVRERGFPFFVQHVYDSPSQSYSDWNTQREEAKDVVTLCRHIAALDPSFAPQSFETLYKDAPPVATWSLPLRSAFSVLLCDPAHVRKVLPVLNLLNSRSDERFLSYVTKVVKALDRYIQPGSDYEVDLLLPLAPLLASKYDFIEVLRLAKNFDKYPEKTKLLLWDRGFLSLLVRSLDSTPYSLGDILPCILGLRRMSPTDPADMTGIALQIWPNLDKSPQQRRDVMEKLTSLLPKIFDPQDEERALFLVSVLSTIAGLDEAAVLSIEFWQCLGNLLSNSSDEVHDRTVAILAREFVERGHVLFCFCLLESAFRAQVAGRLLTTLAKADKQGRLASAFLEKAMVFLEKRGPGLARTNKTMDLLVQCKTVDTMRRANTVDLLAHGKFAAAISGLFNALDSEPGPVKDAAAQLALLLLTSGELRQLDDGGADAAARQALSAWGYTLP